MAYDNKYIVFKREDWETIVDDFYVIKDKNKMNDWVRKTQLLDAVVIRTRDAFAAAALHTYANSIAIAARVLGELAPATRDRLQSIADYFHERAIEASDVKTKLPD